MAAKTKTALRQAARRGKIKAELVSIECPHCGGVMNLDTANGIVSPDPAEDATVAVPTEDTVAMQGRKTFRNEAWKITCPHCGGEFDYDTAPDGAVTTGETEAGFDTGTPLPQAKRNAQSGRQARVKAVKPAAIRMQAEPVPITCTQCGVEFEVDVDPAIEEAVVTCPGCGAELTVDTSNTGGDIPGDPGATDQPMPAQNDPDVVAFRKGVSDERRRLMLLDARAKAFPQFASAIDGFKRNGTSVECANNWIFQASAANPTQTTTDGQAYRAAARRDAAVLNRLGTAVPVDKKATAMAEDYDSLAKKRGTMKNA